MYVVRHCPYMQMLVFYTEIEYFKTNRQPTSNNGAAVGASVTVIILLLVAVAVALILVYIWWRYIGRTACNHLYIHVIYSTLCLCRRRAYKELLGGEIAESADHGQVEMEAFHADPPHTISPFTGTMEPIPLDKFKDHVVRMHSNDDYLFSEEYNVSPHTHTPAHSLLAWYVYLYRVLSRVTHLPLSHATCHATSQRTDMPTLWLVSLTVSTVDL